MWYFLEKIADDPSPVVIPAKSINQNKWEGEDEEEDVKVSNIAIQIVYLFVCYVDVTCDLVNSTAVNRGINASKYLISLVMSIHMGIAYIHFTRFC